MSKLREKYNIEPTTWRQLILLDDKGYIIASCDSLFSTQGFRTAPVFHLFPLLESIFPNVQQLKTNDPAIRISKIQTIFQDLPGFYDFTFIRTDIDSRAPLLWTIYDYTRLYQDYYLHQQRQYELDIARELLKRIK